MVVLKTMNYKVMFYHLESKCNQNNQNHELISPLRVRLNNRKNEGKENSKGQDMHLEPGKRGRRENNSAMIAPIAHISGSEKEKNQSQGHMLIKDILKIC